MWRATDTILTRPAAVKLLHAGYARHGEALARLAGPASDLYALGVVACECLAWSPPSSGGAPEVAIAPVSP